MKVQSVDQLVDAAVDDCAGRFIGRVVAVHTGADLFSVEWIVVRASYRRARLLPGHGAIATMTGLQVPLTKDQVLASPPVRRHPRASTSAGDGTDIYVAQRFWQRLHNSSELGVDY